jgi:hypothetical protein
MIKRIFKIIGGIFILFLLLFGGLLAFSTLTDYSPEPGAVEITETIGDGLAISGDTFSVLIWNVGY